MKDKNPGYPNYRQFYRVTGNSTLIIQSTASTRKTSATPYLNFFKKTLTTLLKKGSNTVTFLWNFQNSQQHLFYKTPPVAGTFCCECICSAQVWNHINRFILWKNNRFQIVFFSTKTCDGQWCKVKRSICSSNSLSFWYIVFTCIVLKVITDVTYHLLI